MAETLWVPWGRFVTGGDTAVPPVSATAGPTSAKPSRRNWTVPVGVPVPDVGETVAVKVTGSPALVRLFELERVVAVSPRGGAVATGSVNTPRPWVATTSLEAPRSSRRSIG